MWENSHLNPRELTSFFGALSPLAMGGGTLPSPAQDFKRQSHDRSRGSTCSSQVQGQSARIKAGLGTASLAPRPLPPTRHTPASACPKTKCGLLVAESHVTGVVLVGEVMNAVRKHKQNDGGYPSMHVILCLAASLCLCPPAHHTPRVHTTHTHTHTHTHTLRRPLRLAASLSACTIPRHTHPARAHTHPRPHTACTHASSPYPPPPQTAHEHPAPTRTPLQRVHARTCTHTERCPLPGCDALPLSLPTRHTCKPTHTHSHPAPPRPPHHPPPPTPTYTHTLCCPWPACVSRPLSLPPPPQAHARAAHSNHATPPGHVTDTPHTASPSPTSPHCVCSCPLSFSFLPSSVIVPLLLAPLPPPSQDRVPLR